MAISRVTTFVLVCGVASAVAPARTSAQTEPPPVEALRTPTAPAFALLGLEPSAVERPMTPSDAAIALVDQFRNGTVPKNFAFESSPYWLTSRPHVTWRDDARRSIAQSLARTTSVSLATAETGTQQAPISSLAVGVRTLVMSGELSQATRKAFEDLETRLGANGALFLSMMNERGLTALENQLRDCTLPLPPAPTPSQADRKKCADQYETQKRALTETVLQSDAFKKAAAPLLGIDIVPKREGFLLEMATAFVWDFPRGAWETHQIRTRAFWATPSYESGPWSAVGVFRYEDDALAFNEDAIELGGRGIYSSDVYAVSLEYVERTPVRENLLNRSHRLVGIAEYRVANGTWLVASFGKDRQKTSSAEPTLVAQLGISFNVSKQRYKFP
jgi:hypothetical protein